MRALIRNNSLSLAMTALFVLSLAGQVWTGLDEANDERSEHVNAALDLGTYLTSGHFVEAVFENWESEFLQMGIFVVLTVVLRQKGSPESKPLEGEQSVDAEPKPRRKKAPWPVRRGGVALKVYENSLGVALFALFSMSLALHAVGGAMEFNDDAEAHGSPARVTPASYLSTSRFWFESFQNWQSEFMSIGALVVLSIFLRQKGSPESKPVHEPHSKTGSE